MNLQTLGNIAFRICLASIVLGTLLGLAIIWGDMGGDAIVWRVWSTLAMLCIGSGLTLGICRMLEGLRGGKAEDAAPGQGAGPGSGSGPTV